MGLNSPNLIPAKI